MTFAFPHGHRSLNAVALAGITLLSACGGASDPTAALAVLGRAAADASEQTERGRTNRTPDNASAPNITSVSDIAVTEGKKAVFTVTLSGPAPAGATVRLSLTNKDTTVGNDYSTRLEYSNDAGATYTSVASGGIAVVTPGATSFLVRVTTLNDAATETTEHYNFYVTPVSNIGSVQGYGIGTILDAAIAVVAAPVVVAPAPAPAPVTVSPTAPKPVLTPVPAPAPVTIVAVTPAPAPSSGGVPTPASIAGKPVVGQIVAKSGQVIENVHVTTTSGPCVVLTNVSNVTIRNSEIGPCGAPGNLNSHGIVTIGASNVTISANVIHDVSTGAYITLSSHPVVFEKNYVYNIRGPFPRGSMIQTNGLKGGSGASRITCNISDAMPGTRYGVSHDWHNVEDHINLFETSGSSSARVEIAYNRIRGGHPTSTSGSGINSGDGQVGSGWIWAHHNTITNVRNVGMAITGGQNITLENNRIYQNSATIPVSVGMYGHNYSANACTGGAMLNNRIWTSNSNPLWNSGTCDVTTTGNNLNDTSLSASMFDEVPAACK